DERHARIEANARTRRHEWILVEAQVEAGVAHLERRAAVQHLAAEAAVARHERELDAAVRSDRVVLRAVVQGDGGEARAAELGGELGDLGEYVVGSGHGPGSGVANGGHRRLLRELADGSPPRGGAYLT